MLNSLSQSNFSAALALPVGSSVSQYYPIHAEIEKMLKDSSPIQHKKLSSHYFACLLGKAPSSKMNTTETWIHRVLTTIESFDKDAIVKTLLGDKNPSGEGTLLKELIENIGFNNTLLLLVRVSQLVNKLSEEGYNRCQKSKEKLQGNKVFIHSLVQDLLKKPQMQSVPVSLMASMNIDQEEISSSFVKQLEDIALTRTKSRQRIIAGTALAVLAVVAGLAYGLKSSPSVVVWPSICTLAAGSIGQPWYEKASKINLYDLSMMNSVKQQEIIDEFDLQATVNCIGGKDGFFNKLKQSSRNNLEFTNLACLKSYSCSNPSSDLKYALMDEDKIRNLTAKQLSRASSNEKKVILARIKEIQQNSALSDHLKTIDRNNVGEISLFDFVNLSPQQINTLSVKIPPDFLYFITDDQIQEFDFHPRYLGKRDFFKDRVFEQLFQIDMVKLYTVLFNESNPICSADNLFQENKEFPYTFQFYLESEGIAQSRLKLLSFAQVRRLCTGYFLHDSIGGLSHSKLLSAIIEKQYALPHAVIEKQYDAAINAPTWKKIYRSIIQHPTIGL